MAVPLKELEGTWEEVAAHAAELAGRRVRLTVLSSESEGAEAPSFRPPSGRPLLRHTGAWEGDDLEERLAEVIAMRAPVEF